MTRPLAPAGTVPLLDEALHLLRRAPLSTLALHWTGSVPFAASLLWCWSDLMQPRTADSRCAADAFILAILLAWMNVWRAAFAGGMRRIVGGGEDARWTFRRVLRIAATQAFLGATKPLALLGSMLMAFPFASTVALYRNAAVISGSEDLEPFAAIAKARRLARIQPAQAWTLLPVLLFLQFVVAVNLALLLATLPQLVRMLTGYESSFSRSGEYAFENSLFAVLVAMLAWLVFDPFVQAVYCLRCYRADSLETGEDVRAGLKLIRRAAQAGAAILLLAALPMRAASAGISRGELEASVRLAMQAPEYSWRIPPPARPLGSTPWVVAFADRVGAWLHSALAWIGQAIGSAIRWFFRQILSLPNPAGGAAPSGTLHWSLYVLIALILAAAAWILWRRMRARDNRPASAAFVPVTRLDDERLSAAQLPETRWLEMGEQRMAEGDFRLALRAFFLALLAWLGQQEWLTIHPGKSNREYERELLRRARSLGEARQLFAQNVAAFERAWYGMHDVSSEAVEEFRARAGGIKRSMTADAGPVA